MSKDTIQLPKTIFSMKANLPSKEPGIVENWEKGEIFKKLRNNSKGRKKLLSELCDPVDYIPEMIKVDKLLTRFDKDHKGVKVVVDEFGGFVGIIGAEAVLSVLAGWWQE